MSGREIRLSDACARLRAAGVGEVDVLSIIAKAGLRGRIMATGFPSLCIGRKHNAEPNRARVDSRMWRVLCHAEAKANGYECFTRDNALFWTLGDGGDGYRQRSFDVVLLDRPSFELWLRDVVSAYRPGELSQHQIEAWIEDYAGTNCKAAWADFQRHFGARACKRDERFQPAWRKVHGNPQRGQPKKSPALTPA